MKELASIWKKVFLLMDICTLGLEDVEIQEVFFVYANQAEFEHIQKHLHKDKCYTRNRVFPELLQR